MTKVVGIDKNKKADPPCPYCGNPKAHPDFTCPRIGAVEVFEDGGYAVTYVTTYQIQFVPQDADVTEPNE